MKRPKPIIKSDTQRYTGIFKCQDYYKLIDHFWKVEVKIWFDKEAFIDYVFPEYQDVEESLRPVLDEGHENDVLGYGGPESREVMLLIPKKYDKTDLFRVIAHEYGHIVESKFLINPPHEVGFEDYHEVKAEFYESFALAIKEVTEMIRLLTKTKSNE